MVAARELIDFARGNVLIGDTGYDSNEFRAELKARGMKAVIGSRPERKRKIPKNRALYRMRYLVEVLFHNLKRFRGIATRFEETRASYLAIVHIGCICLWLTWFPGRLCRSPCFLVPPCPRARRRCARVPSAANRFPNPQAPPPPKTRTYARRAREG